MLVYKIHYVKTVLLYLGFYEISKRLYVPRNALVELRAGI
jgi:hypothetical protein